MHADMDVQVLEDRERAQEPEIHLDRAQLVEPADPQVEALQLAQAAPVDRLDRLTDGLTGQVRVVVDEREPYEARPERRRHADPLEVQDEQIVEQRHRRDGAQIEIGHVDERQALDAEPGERREIDARHVRQLERLQVFETRPTPTGPRPPRAFAAQAT
jgi:hypothetical protein